MREGAMVVFLTLFHEPEGTVLTVAPQGDLDLVGAVRLRRAVAEAVERHRPVHLDVDFAYVTFLDCAGIRALVRAERRMRDRGGTMAIRRASGMALRLLRFFGLDRRMEVGVERPSLRAFPQPTGPRLARPRRTGPDLNGPDRIGPDRIGAIAPRLERSGHRPTAN